METLQPQQADKRVAEKNNGEGEGREDQASEQSPSASSSSPSHEFSFTISLHSSSTTVFSEEAKAPPSLAVDLSPADDIFFHGHLLPLRLLSHLTVSPRSSVNSLNSFTLPIRDLMPDKEVGKESCDSTSTLQNSKPEANHLESNCNETRGRAKSRPFSLFRPAKWRRESEVALEQEDRVNYKRKLRFDVGNVLKRYARMVRPLLLFRGRKDSPQLRRQPFSFSGSLDLKSMQDSRGRRRAEFSAPASMRTSPSNSGLLVARTALSSSSSDSSMEELQAAIQAAIAHCKNSIAKEEKLKC